MNNKKYERIWWLGVVGAILLVIGGPLGAVAAPEEEYELEIPLGLDEDQFVVPEDNPLTKAKIELGRFLYFDKRMSPNNTISCSTCHMPALAFTDGQPVSAGIHRQQGGRSAPTSINRGFSKAQFWDGRASTLEEQSVGPLTNPIEHGFSGNGDVVAKLNKIEGYKRLFNKAFGTNTITIQHVGKAIASFQRTLISGNSPFDRFDYDGEEKAISAAAKRGKKLFSKQDELAAREIFAMRSGVGQANPATKLQIRIKVEELRNCLDQLEDSLDS